MLIRDLIDLLNTLTVLSALGYASWQDLRSRRVSNKVWAIMILTAFPSAVALLSENMDTFGEGMLVSYGLSILLAVVLGFLLFHLRMWGGADAKALIAISITYPPRGATELSIPSLATFLNACVLSLTSILLILIHNLYARFLKGIKLFEGYDAGLLTKFIVLLTCVKIKWREELRDKYVVVEERRGKRRCIRLRLRGLWTEKPSGAYDEYLWAMPTIPFILFIWIGLAMSCLGVNIPLQLFELLERTFISG